MDECVAVAVAEAVAVAVTEAVAEADRSIHDQSIHDPSIHSRSINTNSREGVGTFGTRFRFFSDFFGVVPGVFPGGLGIVERCSHEVLGVFWDTFSTFLGF